jgi:hypothetical protein
MRLISMKLTTGKFLDGTKTVTRRIGWRFAEPGMRLRAVRQAQGLSRGEKAETLGYIELVDVRDERIDKLLDNRDYGTEEMIKEGFSNWSPREFVHFFCAIHDIKPDAFVRRLEFKRIEIDDGRTIGTDKRIRAGRHNEPNRSGSGKYQHFPRSR